MHYKNITCKAALNKIPSAFPYKYDLNAYRGCSHGCKYCFALYTHKYISSSAGTGGYFNEIFIKTNIAEVLEQTFRKKSWQGEIVNLGGVTDSYQTVEAEKGLMSEVLKICIKYKNPVTLSTKSNLILRDYNLIDELSKIAYVGLASTITTPCDTLSKIIEPGASPSSARFAMLKEFSKTAAVIGVHTMPVIPYLTDTPEAINALYESAKACGADYLIYDMLNLRGDTKKTFLNFIYKYNPEIYKKIIKLYNNAALKQQYEIGLDKIFSAAKLKHGVSSNYSRHIKERLLNQTPPAQAEFSF
jgi:DNA repair photolyase